MSESFDLRELASIPDPLEGRIRPASANESAVVPTPVNAEVGPTRTMLRRRRLFAVVLGFAWLLAIQIAIGIRPDVPGWIMALHVGVPMLLGAIALWLAVHPGPVGLGPSVKSVAAFGVGAALVFGVASLCTPCLESGVVLAESSFLCGDFIMAIAVVPLIAIAWAQRRSWAAGVGFRTALLGSAVGFSAAGMQALHCPHSDGLHVLFGHGWPVVALGLVAYLLLRKKLQVA